MISSGPFPITISGLVVLPSSLIAAPKCTVLTSLVTATGFHLFKGVSVKSQLKSCFLAEPRDSILISLNSVPKMRVWGPLVSQLCKEKLLIVQFWETAVASWFEIVAGCSQFHTVCRFVLLVSELLNSEELRVFPISSCK